jgi:hypothetical protein
MCYLSHFVLIVLVILVTFKQQPVRSPDYSPVLSSCFLALLPGVDQRQSLLGHNLGEISIWRTENGTVWKLAWVEEFLLGKLGVIFSSFLPLSDEPLWPSASDKKRRVRIFCKFFQFFAYDSFECLARNFCGYVLAMLFIMVISEKRKQQKHKYCVPENCFLSQGSIFFTDSNW